MKLEIHFKWKCPFCWGFFKADNSIEIHVHRFRLLVGNCRALFAGLVVDLLGEPSISDLSRMQHMLPLSLIIPARVFNICIC